MARFGFLSTYPPTRCGLATFTAELASAIAADDGDESVVVRVDDLVPAGPPLLSPHTTVIGDLRPNSAPSRLAAIEALNTCDVAIVQHEYGIYGGRDGDEVLEVVAGLQVPSIVVCHTVLENPSPHQRQILQSLARLAGALVVMTRTAKNLLERDYGVAAGTVTLIPHGVSARVTATTAVSHAAQPQRPIVLSWGLIGPGKGIEWGIRAFAQLTDLEPRPIYRVLGQTHPKVVHEHGEQYRDALTALVARLGLTGDVQIDGGYRESDELAAEIAAASIVLLPYDSREQSTSGVLVEAVAAGKLVIATRFPHAVELLSGGNGVLVDHGNPREIAQAIRRSIRHPIFVRRAVERAKMAAEGTNWGDVADRYKRVLVAPLSLSEAVS